MVKLKEKYESLEKYYLDGYRWYTVDKQGTNMVFKSKPERISIGGIGYWETEGKVEQDYDYIESINLISWDNEALEIEKWLNDNIGLKKEME